MIYFVDSFDLKMWQASYHADDVMLTWRKWGGQKRRSWTSFLLDENRWWPPGHPSGVRASQVGGFDRRRFIPGATEKCSTWMLVFPSAFWVEREKDTKDLRDYLLPVVSDWLIIYIYIYIYIFKPSAGIVFFDSAAVRFLWTDATHTTSLTHKLLHFSGLTRSTYSLRV